MTDISDQTSPARVDPGDVITARDAQPWVPVVSAVRSLVIVGLIASFLYGVLTTAGRGFCPGGATGDGGFIDADGAPTDTAPQCISLALTPSLVVFVAFGGIVLWALTVVARRALTEAAALRVIKRSMIAIVVVLVASVVISHVWFALLPVDEWDGVNTFFVYPFPFGSVSLDISPMNG
ncbi:hypothetical protein KXS11_02255 [Plantibacter flavus]|uniref:hypothetical protein n=1 Tax=Plantibacter flavus TaxID=150123 RepID=UPI003F153817